MKLETPRRRWVLLKESKDSPNSPAFALLRREEPTITCPVRSPRVISPSP
jgi:hypothetical protein